MALLASQWHGALTFAAMPAFSALDMTFAVAPLARPFLLLLALATPAVALWTFARGRSHDGFYLSAFAASMALVLVSSSVAAFVFSWESMALLSALLIGSAHGDRSTRRALFSYTVVGQIGALCITGAFAMLGFHAGSFRFEDIAAASATLAPEIRSGIFALVLVGFGSKMGLVPLHFWLPRAHPAAPANASALLSGVMLAVALYGLMLSSLHLASPLPAPFGLAMLVVGVVSAIVGALYAALDSDVKRLLAYSSIENMGMAASALGIGLIAQAEHATWLVDLAVAAALFVAINHGAFKSLLFLAAGTIAQTAGTSNLDSLGGLARTLRFSAPLVLLACMAASALPPTNGFASEWLLLTSLVRGIAATNASVFLRSACLFALTGLAFASGFAALAFVKFFGVGFLGRARRERVEYRERFDASVAGFVWLGFSIVLLGLAPLAVLRPLAPTADFTPLPSLSWMLALLPFAGGMLAVAYARATRVRRVATWTCGSPVTVRAQYSAGAFSNPLRRIVARVIPASTERTIGAIVQRFARRTRIVQSGLLRVYVAYAVCAVILVLALAR